jgi:hypothetical protein
MDILTELQNNKTMFFIFMREKYPVYQKSNLFLRDLQYAIMSYFGKKEVKVKYGPAEKIALQFAESLEKSNEITRLGKYTWKLNFSLDPVVKEEKAAEIVQN